MSGSSYFRVNFQYSSKNLDGKNLFYGSEP